MISTLKDGVLAADLFLIKIPVDDAKISSDDLSSFKPITQLHHIKKKLKKPKTTKHICMKEVNLTVSEKNMVYKEIVTGSAKTHKRKL